MAKSITKYSSILTSEGSKVGRAHCVAEKWKSRVIFCLYPTSYSLYFLIQAPQIRVIKN